MSESAARVRCYACETNQHTNPGPNEPLWKHPSISCQCGERTCACYGLQVRAGIRTDRSQRV